MRIGLDGIALPLHFSGAAHYIINLIQNILLQKRSFAVTVFCKPDHCDLFEKYLQQGDQISPVYIKDKIQQILFYELKLEELLVEKNIDLFHAMHYICPPSNSHYKVITTFHDMGFITHPNYYPYLKRKFFSIRLPIYIRRSDCIVSVSKQTAEDIKKVFPGIETKIKTIYPGIDHLPENIDQSDTNKIILAVNTFEKRKNIPFLIDVFNQISERSENKYQLILVGQKSNDFPTIKDTIDKSPFKERIKIKINISEEELVQLYRESEIFLNASEFEGFGFTTFEAIQQLCPVIVYRKAVPDGIIRQHPYVMDELNTGKWVDTILNAIQSKFTKRIRKDYIKHLTWENTASNMVQLYLQQLNLPEN